MSDAASWAVRRELYEDVLAAGGFAFVARDGDADVAYALAGTEPAHWPATFATASEYAELHTLAVRADQRGRGRRARRSWIWSTRVSTSSASTTG